MEDEEYQGWFVEWIEEWSQFLGGCNWYTFNLIKIEFEDERIMGGVETTWIILGLGIRVRWNYTITEDVSLIKEHLEEIKEERNIS